MVTKTSAAMALLSLLFILGILIATSEGARKKGKFVTPGGSHCKWIEKSRHNGSDVSYTLVCKCHAKGGGTMRYSCNYRTSYHGRSRGTHSHEFTDSFLQVIKGYAHGCNMNSFNINESDEARMVARGEATANDCK